jgi:integrase
MSVGKITKSAVDRMQPNSVLWDQQVVGFGVRRHSTERRHYLLRYRFQGKQTFKRIGTHGSPFTPEMARQEALRLLGQIVSGVNPTIAERRGVAFGEELDRYLEKKRRELKPSAFAQTERHLRKLAAPLHSVALADIDRRAIAQLLANVERSGPAARNRLRSSLSAFFVWLVKEGLIDVNPVSLTAKAEEGGSRDRVLSEAELVSIWKALNDDDASDIIRLLILTGQRRDEIARMSWSEVDWDRAMLVLPSVRTKNSIRHKLPLAPLALDILRRRWANANGKGNDGAVFKPLSWTYAKDRLDAQLAGIAPFRLHDIRRTAATGMAELGVLPHIIECVLNHISGHKAGVAGIYNKSKNEAAMRDALQRWAAHVDTLRR